MEQQLMIGTNMEVNETNEIEGINRIIYALYCMGVFIIIAGVIALIVISELFAQKIWI
jgi:hypothetical protein